MLMNKLLTCLLFLIWMPFGVAEELPATLKPEPHQRDPYIWKDRHQMVLDRHREIKPEYVVIGDSITHFWGGEPEYGSKKTGQASWDKLFGKHTVTNMGFGFDLIDNACYRVQHGELDNITPRVIILLIGTNNIGYRKDSAQTCAANTEALIKLIGQKCPGSTILLLGILPRLDPHLADTIASANNLYAKLANGKNIIYANPGKVLQATDSLQAQRQYMSDGVHLSALGYEKLSEELSKILGKIDQSY